MGLFGLSGDGFDPYEVLGLQEGCNGDDIKKAWRTLSKKTHPDEGGDAHEFDKVQKAYKMLSMGSNYRKKDVVRWTRGQYTYDGSPFRARRSDS